MIIFGGRASKIGEFDTKPVICSHCGQESPQTMSIFGKYAHIFWIPMFPIGKKAVSECKNCLRTIEQREFSSDLMNEYYQLKSKTKRPIWHRFGLLSIGVLFILLIAIIVTNESDPRDILLKNDYNEMVPRPSMENDSISYKIKEYFSTFVNEDLDHSDFSYYTKINGDKALILVSIPEFKDVEKSERLGALEMIEAVANEQADLRGKDLYIGIKGRMSLMIIKTPTETQNNSILSADNLYEFYGPKPISNK